MKKRRGFTLIELVMVVAILGVLSSIALVKYTDVSEKSKENSDYITASNIATAAKLALNSNVEQGKINVKYLVDNKYLESQPMVQSISGNKSFDLTFNEGIVTVKVDNKVFYPKDIEDTIPGTENQGE